MSNNLKKENGITMLALGITVVLLIFFSAIVLSSSKESIRRAQLEELRTNMLLIQAKAKEFVEEANFKIGIKPTDEAQLQEYETKKQNARLEVYVSEAKLEKADPSISSNIEITDDFYKVTRTALQNWGLDTIETKDDEAYLIQFDDENAKVEIYNTKGNNGKYSLTELDKDDAQ